VSEESVNIAKMMLLAVDVQEEIIMIIYRQPIVTN